MINRTPFIIAEMSGNHGGSLLRACDMIAAAKNCGADSVKIQLYEPEDLNDPANNEIYNKCKVPREWLPQLFRTADLLSIPLFSSVFAPWAIEELEQYNCPAYKLASPESTRLNNYLELAVAIHKTGKTFIASSGARDWYDVRALKAHHMLYCKAGYPADLEFKDLEFIRYQKTGFSDHTSGLLAPIAAIWAGAKIIEKHFKLDDDCIDAAFSLNPEQMKLLCDIAHK